MTKKVKALRRLGDITMDMEPLLREMAIDHDMQVHEILGILHSYLISHCPGSVETYAEDNSHPVFAYTHWSNLK